VVVVGRRWSSPGGGCGHRWEKMERKGFRRRDEGGERKQKSEGEVEEKEKEKEKVCIYLYWRLPLAHHYAHAPEIFF
jgi:hypothetical protein